MRKPMSGNDQQKNGGELVYLKGKGNTEIANG
jgi:hypothetical protein